MIEATEFKHALERIVGAFVVAFACFFFGMFQPMRLDVTSFKKK